MVHRLDRAIKAAIALREELEARYPDKPSITECEYLPINRKGRIKKEAQGSVQQRLKQAMEKDGLGHVYRALHDLKRKGINDAEDTDIAGHRSEAMKDRYHTRIEPHTPAA